MPTIDDQIGDPTTSEGFTYSPIGSWFLGAIGGCPDCALPSRGDAFLGSFHGSFFSAQNPGTHVTPPTASVKFTGSSVAVICILSGSNTSLPSNLAFDIDGVQQGTFAHIPTGSAQFLANQTVFARNNLTSGQHTLVIQNANGLNPSFVMLDSVIYGDSGGFALSPTTSQPAGSTTPASANSRHSNSLKKSTIVILTTVILVTVVTLIVLLVFWMRRRRRTRRIPSHEPDLTPFGKSYASSTAEDGRDPTRFSESHSDSNTISSSRQSYLRQELREAQSKIVDVDDLERQMLSPHRIRGRILRLIPPRTPSTLRKNLRDATAQLTSARARNEELMARIRELEIQMQSPWALGLSDEPPPGYSREEEA
ncbi:hypothetical protein FB45DRAFT_943393 [Roridomyces roridus]|uniref:Uncharacterized protein n=1 Tax=Roridomyces roridus TaxID=1738132 RepID=A0AAD7F900_9AGAR|nr:hypothetical protein FB45DRAFT_943393 [Roridomyces roridus]